MKKVTMILTLIVPILFNDIHASAQDEPKVPKESIYKLSMKSLDGETIDLSKYKGKKILIVNTASKCGFTPQYDELETLSKQYKNKLVVIGFPADNFKNQEPGSNAEIAEFCKRNYGVSFPMAEKTEVIGAKKNKVYQWLTDPVKNGWNKEEPSWNFCKYLINEKGELVKFFPSKVTPMDKEITSLL